MKTYRTWQPDRNYLLPPATRDWLPEDHLAWTILDVVDELDIGDIESVLQSTDPRGTRPYQPRMMIALLLYAYCTGTYSSRGIARATWTDLAFRVIAAEDHPHFTTINQFRLDHLLALKELFKQVLKLCQHAGMVALGHVALDGSKVQANASKHKAMSYDRMNETEARLESEIDALMSEANATDRKEDVEFGKDGDGVDLPDEIRRRDVRKTRIQAAKSALELEAKAARKAELTDQADRAAAAAKAESDPAEAAKLTRRATAREAAAAQLGDVDTAVIPGSGTGLPFHTVPHERDGTPKPKAQRNFTDPDSRIMTSNGGYMQAYNVQVVADEKSQIILAEAVTNQAPDVEHLPALLDQVQHNTGHYPKQASVDAGYYSAENVRFCEENGIDAYISTRRRKHEEPVLNREVEGTEAPAANGKNVAHTPVLDDADDPPVATAPDPGPREKMEAKVTSKEGRKVYAKRKWVVEPVFGDIKEARRFRRFSLRGLWKVAAEFSLVCLAHNLRKLHLERRRRAIE